MRFPMLVRCAAIFVLALLAAVPSAAQPGKGGGESGTGGGRSSSQGGDARGGSDEATIPDASRGSPIAEAEAFEAWCRDAKRASIPGLSADDVLRIFLPLVRNGFPQALIRRRIQEASSKGVGADLAIQAFERDADDFAFLLETSRAYGWPPSRATEAFFSDASAALRTGIGKGAVEEVFSLSRRAKIDPKRAGVSLATAASYRIEHRCSEQEASGLAVALAASKIPSGKIPTVLSLASKAANAGLGAEGALSRVMDALRRGGGLNDVKKALGADRP